MTSKPKFLADEDVDARLVKSLSNRGIDIVFAPKGIRNSSLYFLACEKQRVLLSFDKDFLNTSLFTPSRLPAIIIVRIHLPELAKLESLLVKWVEKFSDKTRGNTWIITEEGARIVD